MPNFSQLQKLKRNVQKSRPKISLEAGSRLPHHEQDLQTVESVLLNYELSDPQQQQEEQLVVKLAKQLSYALQQFIQENVVHDIEENDTTNNTTGDTTTTNDTQDSS